MGELWQFILVEGGIFSVWERIVSRGSLARLARHRELATVQSWQDVLVSKYTTLFSTLIGHSHSVATPALLCHKEPDWASKDLLAGSLWHKG